MNLLACKPKNNTDDSMIPMINIVFLLIIFFMIAGKIEPLEQEGIDLPVIDGGKSTVNKEVVIQLNREEKVFVNGEYIDFINIDTVLPEYLESDQAVSLQVDSEITAEVLNKLLVLIRASGVTKITLYAQNKKAKR